jgi:inhibitor of KinA
MSETAGFPKFRVMGDRGLLVEYGDKIDPEINRKVRLLTLAFDHERFAGIIEVIPTYKSLLVVYDPLQVDCESVMRTVESLEADLPQLRLSSPRTIYIPVCYGSEFGPDIEFVARHNGLTVEDVIRIHSETVYMLYMIGFTPGFSYLGGLAESLHTPRLETPRAAVHAGSVGIANDQTGMYAVSSPGGWRIIGRTPLKLFDPARDEPFLYSAGDFIKFTPISEEEYSRIANEGLDGSSLKRGPHE